VADWFPVKVVVDLAARRQGLIEANVIAHYLAIKASSREHGGHFWVSRNARHVGGVLEEEGGLVGLEVSSGEVPASHETYNERVGRSEATTRGI